MSHEVGRGRFPDFRHSDTVCGTRSFEALQSADAVPRRSWPL
jgi:hypothetical protein